MAGRRAQLQRQSVEAGRDGETRRNSRRRRDS
jgi:hypothetical protein